MPAMDTAKQIFYKPPMTLLPKRKDSTVSTTTTTHHHHFHPNYQGPTLTVTFPFPFTQRLSRLDAKRLNSAASIRRSRTTPRTTANTPRTTSLPRLSQPSAKVSNTTSRSSATPTGSEDKKKTSWEGGSVESGAEEDDVVDVPQDAADGRLQEAALSPEEREWKRVNDEKCLRWLEGLPEKFSSMHVVQHVVYNPNKQSGDGSPTSVFLS